MTLMEIRGSLSCDEELEDGRLRLAREAAEKTRSLIYKNERRWNPLTPRKVGAEALQQAAIETPESV